MNKSTIEAALRNTFPNLVAFNVTSRETPCYNCIAWSLGISNRWWWPPSGGASSPLCHCWFGSGTDPSIGSFIEMYEGHGFEQCNGPEPEVGYEKVVVYGHGNVVLHASRLLPNGKWTSKLGNSVDISYSTPNELEGTHYGNVLFYFRRRLSE